MMLCDADFEDLFPDLFGPARRGPDQPPAPRGGPGRSGPCIQQVRTGPGGDAPADRRKPGLRAAICGVRP